MNTITELTIDRSKWRCGQGSMNPGRNSHGKGCTRLYNSEDYMCCLGFYCEQSGIDKKMLLDLALPSSVSSKLGEVIPHLTYQNLHSCGRFDGTVLQSKAININDNISISRELKESQLIDLFGSVNIKVVFIGEYETV